MKLLVALLLLGQVAVLFYVYNRYCKALARDMQVNPHFYERESS